MYYLPDKYIFLSTPRAASRSTAAIIQRLGGFKISHRHHPEYLELVTGRSFMKEPMFTFTRHPVTHAASIIGLVTREGRGLDRIYRNNSRIMNMSNVDLSIERFCKDRFLHIPHMYTSSSAAKLNPFAEFAQIILPLENGIKNNFKILGLDLKEEDEPEVGRLSKSRDNLITQENIELTKKYFPYDWEVYERALEEI